MKWWQKIPWVKAFGATILFISWIAQNYFIAERKNEINYLNLAQLSISIEEGHLNEWTSVFLLESEKEIPNKKVIKYSARKAAQHQLNILTWATARVTDPKTHDQLLKEKYNLREKINEAYEQEDQTEIIKWLNAVVEAANKEGPSLIQASEKRYAVARNQIEIWNKLFLFLYIIGSLLFGVGVFIGWQNQGRA